MNHGTKLRWFVHRNGETAGPHDEDTIVGWIRSGMREAVLRPDTTDPSSPWMPLASHAAFAAALHEKPKGSVPTSSPASTSLRNLVTGLVLLALVAAAILLWLRAVMGQEGLQTSLATAVQAPLELENETVSVEAAHSRAIPVRLPYSGQLDLNVSVVKGEYVNVYVVDAAGWAAFKSAKQAFFGGKFNHYPAFEATKTQRSHTHARLGAGAYYIVLENPTLGLLVADSFDVAVKARLEP